MTVEPKLRNVGITGADGYIGSVLLRELTEYNLRPFVLRSDPGLSEAVVADLADMSQLKHAFRGLDAVIHLAAESWPEPPGVFEKVMSNNILATHNVLEECVTSGVKRLIFASSNHVMHGYTMLSSPTDLNTDYVRMHGLLRVSDPPNPSNHYGWSKACSEIEGRMYSEAHSLEFIALRIGITKPGEKPDFHDDAGFHNYWRAMWLSRRDLIQAFRCSLAVSLSNRFVVAHIVSANDSRVFDLDETLNSLGFRPTDNVEVRFPR